MKTPISLATNNNALSLKPLPSPPPPPHVFNSFRHFLHERWANWRKGSSFYWCAKKGADKFFVNRMCTFISICDEDVHFLDANKCQTEGQLTKQNVRNWCSICWIEIINIDNDRIKMCLFAFRHSSKTQKDRSISIYLLVEIDLFTIHSTYQSMRKPIKKNSINLCCHFFVVVKFN